jgi:hypothetical protein
MIVKLEYGWFWRFKQILTSYVNDNSYTNIILKKIIMDRIHNDLLSSIMSSELEIRQVGEVGKTVMNNYNKRKQPNQYELQKWIKTE